MKRRTKTASVDQRGERVELGLDAVAERAPGHRRQGRHGAEVVEGDLEVVEAEDEADTRNAPSTAGQMLGSVTSQKVRSGPRAEHHRRLVEAPVVAGELGEHHQEREGQAIGGVGEDRRGDVAGQAQDVAVEHQRRDADQHLARRTAARRRSRSAARGGGRGSAGCRSRPRSRTAPRARRCRARSRGC